MPAPRRAKTRLIPLLGPGGAARFQAALLSDALAKLNAFKTDASRYLFITGRGRINAAGFTILRQRGPDLGARLEGAFRMLLRRHPFLVIMGTDSPLLAPSTLRAALGELRVCDAVLGPCTDGGYYLIGLRRFERGMLCGVRWGTSHALRDTLRNLTRKGFSCSLLEPLEDIDLPADFLRLSKLLSQPTALRRRCPAVSRFIAAGLEPARRKTKGSFVNELTSLVTEPARSSLHPPLPHLRRILPPGRE